MGPLHENIKTSLKLVIYSVDSFVTDFTSNELTRILFHTGDNGLKVFRAVVKYFMGGDRSCYIIEDGTYITV